MNADGFRHLYEYHFAINRKIWDSCIEPLDDDLFTQKVEYSVGSVRNQVVHMLNVDDRWFSGLRGVEVPGWHVPEEWPSRVKIRAEWDRVEADMRDYLVKLTDDMLYTQPFLTRGRGDITDQMLLWQILIHVANHGTDHRAQLLSLLNRLGVETFPQDYMFFVWEKL